MASLSFISLPGDAGVSLHSFCPRLFFILPGFAIKGLHKADVDLRLFVKRTAAALGIKKKYLFIILNLLKAANYRFLKTADTYTCRKY